MIETTIRRLLRPVVELRERETALTLLMFSYSFLAMAGYNIIKPATRSKFIASLGAENLPYVMLIAGLLMGVIMQQYGRLVTLLPRRWMFPGTQAALVGFLLAFWALFKTGQPWVSAAFYFWGLLLGIFLISQFWTLANDVYDPRQAKRLFGFIGGGASLGGTAGAGVTVWLARPLGTDNLLLVSAGFLALGTGLSWYLTHRTDAGRQSAVAATSEEQVGGKEVLRLLRESRPLRLIALIIGFAAMGAVILEQQLNMATEAFVAGQDAITSFLATITFYISVIAFVVQIWLTGRIHRFLGVGFALLVLPVSLAVTSSLILFFPVMWIAALARVQDSSLRYTLDKTSREILFLPLPADLKHKAKPFVDVAVDRLMGKGLASILLLLLLKVFDFEWYQLSYLSLAMVSLWIAMAVRAKREYIAGFRRRLAQGNLSAEEVVLLSPDLSTLEILVRELANPDERRVLNAIDLLELLDQRLFVTPLLLRHDSALVRARALRVMAAAQPEAADEWLPAIESGLVDGHPEVRAAALAAFGAIKGTAALDVMRLHLADPDPEILAMAARALAESGPDEDVDASERAVSRLIEDSRAVARSAVARAIGDSPHRIGATRVRLGHPRPRRAPAPRWRSHWATTSPERSAGGRRPSRVRWVRPASGCHDCRCVLACSAAWTFRRLGWAGGNRGNAVSEQRGPDRGEPSRRLRLLEHSRECVRVGARTPGGSRGRALQFQRRRGTDSPEREFENYRGNPRNGPVARPLRRGGRLLQLQGLGQARAGSPNKWWICLRGQPVHQGQSRTSNSTSLRP